MYFLNRDRRQNELQLAVRRILDLTTLNLSVPADRRREERYARILPALLLPWRHGRPVVGNCNTVLTKDISDHGMALIVPEPCDGPQVLVGLWLLTEHLGVAESEPVFFVSNVRNCRSLGGGYWQVGVELESVAKSAGLHEVLRPLAERLLPQYSLREVPALSSAGRAFV